MGLSYQLHIVGKENRVLGLKRTTIGSEDRVAIKTAFNAFNSSSYSGICLPCGTRIWLNKYLHAQ